MKAKAPELEDAEMDITPMIDVVFLLITFFMVVAAVITDKYSIELPTADESTVPENTEGRLEVSMSPTGDLFLGTSPVTEDQLASVIQQQRNMPNFSVYIRADANTEHADVQEFMDFLANNYVFELKFGSMQE